jgi:hypothetical protein
MSTSPTSDGGDSSSRVSRTRFLLALQFIVIVCLIFYSEDVHEMKKSISWSPLLSNRSGRVSFRTNNNSLSNSSGVPAAPPVWEPSDQVCQWQLDHKECLELLRARLPPPYHNRRWAFFGDSTMARLTKTGKLTNLLNTGASMTQCNCRRRSANRCNVCETLGFVKAATWIPPNSTIEGPMLFGLEHPQCQDCSGCNPQLVECNALPCNSSTMSYFSIEFARDVEIQTTLTRTTQEAVSLYLEKQQSLEHPFTCVVSTGAHDMNGTMTLETIIKNIDWYLGLLRRNCVHLIYSIFK